MTDINQLSRWNRDISRAIAALGTEHFFPALVEAINGQVKVDYPQVWLYHRDLPPRVLYHEIPSDAVPSQIDEYLEGPYREDPFYQASMNQPRAKIYRLSRVTMGKLEQSSYYREYYADTGTCDEAIYLAKLHGGNVINLSMMRLPEHGEFSEREYECLYLLAEPVSDGYRPPDRPGVPHFRRIPAFATGEGCAGDDAAGLQHGLFGGQTGHRPGNGPPPPQEYLPQAGRLLPVTCSPCSSTPCPAWVKPVGRIPSAYICPRVNISFNLAPPGRVHGVS
jgi:hypothetical protein